jgi:hypothetical protein
LELLPTYQDPKLIPWVSFILGISNSELSAGFGKTSFFLFFCGTIKAGVPETSGVGAHRVLSCKREKEKIAMRLCGAA